MSVVSYVLRLLTGEAATAKTCRYHPTCSQYAHDAIHEHGLAKGSLRAAWRVLRCNPWSRGGVDYA